MKRIVDRLACAVLCLSALSGPVMAERVARVLDERVEFSRFRTFAWVQGTPAQRDSAQQTIVEAVERELKARGWRRVTDQPDAWVTTHALVARHSLEELSDPETWRFWTGVTDVNAYQVGSGTLVVDVIDAATGKTVWRGVATETVSGTPKKMARKIDREVRRLFRQFPVPRR